MSIAWRPGGGGGGGQAIVTYHTASGTHTWQPNVKGAFVFGRGGGGGAGGGCTRSAANWTAGGSGGSTGGFVQRFLDATECVDPVTVTIAAGGTGGTGPSAPTANGNNGAPGGDTSFGGLLTARGGGGGGGATGTSAATSTAAPSNTAVPRFPPFALHNGVGLSGSTNQKTPISAQHAFASSSDSTGCSGGSGSGVNTSNAWQPGSNGGAVYVDATLETAGGVGGASEGSNGSNGADNAGLNAILMRFGLDFTHGHGTGGGGGAGGATMDAGNGGDGGLYGAGGGGGGGARDGFKAGDGGDGAQGLIVVVEFT